MGRFSAGIAHNIRNSLTVMMNLLELVQQNPAEQAVLGSAQRAFETLDALLRLVNDVNALARASCTASPARPVEMEPFLDRLLAAFRAEPLGKERSVVITRDPSARVLVVDPDPHPAGAAGPAPQRGPRHAAPAPMELVVRPLEDAAAPASRC